MKMKLQQAFLALFMALAFSCSGENADAESYSEAENEPAIEQELLGLVNDHRASLGQPPLSFSQVAYKYANQHTDYMVAAGSISHYNFSARASGIASEVDARAVAENVAKDYTTARQALEGWLGSESHKKTMEGDFSHTAISVKRDSRGTLYYTQLFYLE